MWRRTARVALAVAVVPGLAAAAGGRPMAVPPPGHVGAARPLAGPGDGRPSTVPTPVELNALVDRFPRADFDPAARAALLGEGVAPPLGFVRDGVRVESYAGVLRGPAGALAARAANAADRSLLLAALLTARRVPVRFAFGTLGDDAARRLVDRAFDPAPPPRAVDPTPFAARVQARAERDFAAVTAALGGRMPSVAVTRADLLREVRPHVWVQAQVAGAWVDADASFADAAPGRRYCEVARTADALPAAMYQRVTARVVVDRLDGGRVVASTAVEQSWPAADVAGRQVFLFHRPAGGGPDTFVPTLWVDGELTAGRPVDFGDATPAFVAEFLDLELTRLDAPPVRVRRPLIDRGGSAWRAATTPDAAALRPLPRDGQGLADVRAVHNLWVDTGGPDLWSYANAVRWLAAADGPPAASGGFGGRAWPVAMRNFAAVAWADRVVVPAMNAEAAAGSRFYVDAPRVVLFSTTEPVAGTPGQTQVDLLHDFVRGVAADGAGSAAAVARAEVWYGVAEGALAHEWAAEQAWAANRSVGVASTSGLAAAGGRLTVVDAAHPPADPPADPSAAADTTARLAAAVAAGDAVVVPLDALRGGESGWWAVAPDGTTRAVLGDDLTGSRAVYGIGAPGGDVGRRGTHATHPDDTVGRHPPPCGNMQSKTDRGPAWPGCVLPAADVATVIWDIVRVL